MFRNSTVTFMFLYLHMLLTTVVVAHPTPAADTKLMERSCQDPINGPLTAYEIGIGNAHGGLPDAHPKTGKIHWGNVANPLALCDGMHNNGPLPDPVCFGGHGITNRYMDHAVAVFCRAADGLILNLNNPNNSVAMTYTYWPPSVAPNNDKWDGCTEAGQIYTHIGFDLGAPNKTASTLSELSCARGLRQVHNMGCDNSHVDNKHGEQIDLGRFEAPAAKGRSMYCTNYMRFVPNLEDTHVLDEFVDPRYEVHMDYGGMDKWTIDPPSWKDHESGKAGHETKKAFWTFTSLARTPAKGGHEFYCIILISSAIELSAVEFLLGIHRALMARTDTARGTAQALEVLFMMMMAMLASLLAVGHMLEALSQSRPASIWFPGSKDSAAPLRSSTCFGHYVYMHIGFGLGGPDIKYTLSEYACVRELQRVYNNDCDASHEDSKHGGQLDLGTFVPPLGPDTEYNDHLFYLPDPNPPLVGRNSHCCNGANHFVPNLENSKVLEE
nr:hypothetical protein B0A51_07899 [Rachicladosporium sp. CCFEE 5018]